MSIERRLQRLECQARIWRLVAMVAVLCVAVAGGCSDEQGGAGEVSTVDSEAMAEADREMELAQRAYEDAKRMADLLPPEADADAEEYCNAIAAAHERARDHIQKAIVAYPTPEAYATRVRFDLVLTRKFTAETFDNMERDIADGLKLDSHSVDLLSLRDRVAAVKDVSLSDDANG